MAQKEQSDYQPTFMVGIIYNSKSGPGLSDTCGSGEETEQNRDK